MNQVSPNLIDQQRLNSSFQDHSRNDQHITSISGMRLFKDVKRELDVSVTYDESRIDQSLVQDNTPVFTSNPNERSGFGDAAKAATDKPSGPEEDYQLMMGPDQMNIIGEYINIEQDNHHQLQIKKKSSDAVLMTDHTPSKDKDTDRRT